MIDLKIDRPICTDNYFYKVKRVYSRRNVLYLPLLSSSLILPI